MRRSPRASSGTMFSLAILILSVTFCAAHTRKSILGTRASRRIPFLSLSSNHLSYSPAVQSQLSSAVFELRGGAGDDESAVPLKDLQVMLRGIKYKIKNGAWVTTAQELIDYVKKESENDKPHDVLFHGKRLKPTDVLREVGVTDGALLNMVPASSSSGSGSKKKKSKSSASSSSSSDSSSSAAAAASATAATSVASTSESADAMSEYLKSAGVDAEKLDELMKNMGVPGGSGGEGGGMPDMKESMEMMSNMMNSPMFQDFMSNPEMLEQSRQMILNNPMLKGMMGGMPGMSDILNDPEAWKEAMQAAASIYKNMDPEQLKSMMQGGMPPGMGGAGIPPGLFDGTLDGGKSNDSSSAAATAALDELDEDD